MKRKIVILFCLIILIILFIFIYCNMSYVKYIPYSIRQKLYGEPINKETGMINNQFFNINSEGKNAKSTTSGINEAIEYANMNNIEYISLQTGIYAISGEVDNLTQKNEKKGIILKSNIILNLNGSILQHETNNKEMYTIISIYDVQNVTILNGNLKGDKDSHDYSNIDSSHGWGYGIDIKASENVTVSNIEICDMTGDGISISNLPRTVTENKQSITSENICIERCNIYGVRRNGISVISGKNIKIYQNEIHDIEGTAPQSAIDLETNNDGNQEVDDVEIYNNKIYNLNNKSQFAIMTMFHVSKVNIYNNEITGRIILYEADECITIKNNHIKQGEILSKEGREGAIRKEIIINNNILENSNVNLFYVEKAQITNNQLRQSQIEHNNCQEVIIENNKIIE